MSDKPRNDYFTAYCEQNGLPEKAFRNEFPFLFDSDFSSVLRHLFSLIAAEPKEILPDGLYYYRETLRPRAFFDAVKALDVNYGRELFSLYLPLYILLAYDAKTRHEKACVPADISEATLAEIALWGKKHRNLCGRYGLFDYGWCVKYLGGELFRIGELDYQLCENPLETRDLFCRDERVIRIHIPAGCDFSREARQKSYRAAARFYAERLGVKSLTFLCESWLLARDHAALTKSNIADFRRDFTILKDSSDYDSGFLWRIFGAEDTAFPERLSGKTQIQRLYREKLMRHEPFYSALGVFTLSV